MNRYFNSGSRALKVLLSTVGLKAKPSSKEYLFGLIRNALTVEKTWPMD